MRKHIYVSTVLVCTLSTWREDLILCRLARFPF